MNFTEDQIKNILYNIFGTQDIIIKPVGNHYLKRHLVYEIRFTDGKKYIFKLYYIDRRRSREIASLKLLETSNIRCPKIFKYGNLKDGNQWLITQYIEGEVFDKVMDQLSEENNMKIFKEIGEELGKLHSFKTFDFFGEWDEKIHCKSCENDFYEYFINGMEETIEQVIIQSLPNKELLIEAIKHIRDNYHLLDINIIPRLIHGDFDGRNILVKKTEEVYSLSGIIDFEGSYPGNVEKDFVGLYYRYFLNCKNYKEAFLSGYKKLIDFNDGFNERLYMYLKCFVVSNCRWAYKYAPEYYKDNITFLKKIIDV